MAFTEPLGAFFGDFALLAFVDSRPARVIFDHAYAEGLGIAGTAPQITARSTDVAHATVGSAVVVNGTAYTVAAPPQPDGTGVTVLILAAA